MSKTQPNQPQRLKLCPVCGLQAPIDAAKCAQCGHAFSTRFTPAGPTQPFTSSPQPTQQQQIPVMQPVVPGFNCPRCGVFVLIGAQFCSHCGTTFGRTVSQDATVFGILAVVAAGIGIFMCQVLVPFFILTSLILGAFAYNKGAKGWAIASFVMCAFLLAFFIYTMARFQSGLDELRESLDRARPPSRSFN